MSQAPKLQFAVGFQTDQKFTMNQFNCGGGSCVLHFPDALVTIEYYAVSTKIIGTCQIVLLPLCFFFSITRFSIKVHDGLL